MRTKKNTCEVAIHFNKEKHFISEFEFVIVEQVCNLSEIIVLMSTSIDLLFAELKT